MRTVRRLHLTLAVIAAAGALWLTLVGFGSGVPVETADYAPVWPGA